MGIERKLLFLVLSIGVFCFVILGILSFSGMMRAQSATKDKGEEMLGAFDAFAENYAESLIKDRLTERAQLIAVKVSQQFEILDDAENIAKMAEKMLAHPEEYSPQRLTEPKKSTILANKAYIYYSPGVREKLGVDPRLDQRVGLLSNIKDTLEFLSYFYTTGTACYLAMEEGILIRADGADEGQTTSVYEDVFLNREVEIRERPWYVSAIQAKNSFFTDVYKSTNGNMEISSLMPVYDNGKFAGVAGVSMTLDSMRGWIKATKNDINFVVGRDGQVTISSADEGIFAVQNSFCDLRKSSQEDIAKIAEKMVNGESGQATVTVDGTEYYLVYLPVPNMDYSCAVLTDKKVALSPAINAKALVMMIDEGFSLSVKDIFKETLLFLAVLFVAVLVVLYIISVNIARNFVSPILELTEGMKKIATGDLNTRLSINTNDEIEELADSVNAMTVELQSYIEQAKETERIEGELDGARKIQAGMIPSIFPAFPDKKEIDLYASMIPAKEVGGDFYDFYILDKDRLVITIADVSGKGIPASLFMVMSKTILKNAVITSIHEAGDNPVDWGKVLEKANKELCENNEEDMFVTVFFGVIDLKSGDFAYVNGGHNPPLISREGKFDYLRMEKKSNMLGLFDFETYHEYHLTLIPGDTLFLYTDGVTEAMNENEEIYSEERLQEILNEGDGKNVKDMLNAVRENVREYVGKAEQSDDITMLGVIFLGEAGRKIQ